MPRILTVPLGDTVLPVVDVTNPAFVISPSADEMGAMIAQYIKESTQSQNVSPEIQMALSRSLNIPKGVRKRPAVTVTCELAR